MTHGLSVENGLLRDKRDPAEQRISTCVCLQEGWAHGSQAGRRSGQKAPPRNGLKTNNQGDQ